MAFTGKKNATKREMIEAGLSLYPEANWPRHAGKISEAKAEHLADAIATIHAGVQTQMFQSIMRIHAQS